ncbi:hypothetical protein D3C72_1858450 [compost metagenome]
MGRPERPDRRAQAEDRFALADQNGDGALSPEEFAAALAAPPQRAHSPHEGFPGLRPRPESRTSEQEVLAYFDQASARQASENLEPVEAPASEPAAQDAMAPAVPSDPDFGLQLEAILADPSDV